MGLVGDRLIAPNVVPCSDAVTKYDHAKLFARFAGERPHEALAELAPRAAGGQHGLTHQVGMGLRDAQRHVRKVAPRLCRCVGRESQLVGLPAWQRARGISEGLVEGRSQSSGRALRSPLRGAGRICRTCRVDIFATCR